MCGVVYGTFSDDSLSAAEVEEEDENGEDEEEGGAEGVSVNCRRLHIK